MHMKKMEFKALNKGMLITFQYSNPNLMSFISEIWKNASVRSPEPSSTLIY